MLTDTHVHTNVHIYMYMHTYTSMRSYFNCFVGTGHFQSNLGVFLKAVLYIQRFMGLLCLKEGSPAEPLVGAAEDDGSEVGPVLTKRTERKARCLTSLF